MLFLLLVVSCGAVDYQMLIIILLPAVMNCYEYSVIHLMIPLMTTVMSDGAIVANCLSIELLYTAKPL